MKKLLTAAIFIIAILLGLLFRQGQKTQPKAVAGATEQSDDPERRVTRDTNGEMVIHIDAATREIMGLQTAPLQTRQLPAEVKVFGRVMDPVMLSINVSDLLAARATAEVSRKELLRMNLLAGENNASARAVEAAEGAARRDAGLAETAQAKLIATVGNVLSKQTNLIEFIHSLANGESALVLIDLPAGETMAAPPASAVLLPFTDEGNPVEARFMDAPLGINPGTQTRELLFLVATNRSRLVGGAAVTGVLRGSGEAQAGFVVPRAAIIRFNGTTWVYVEAREDMFERREIHLERALADGWFATLKADQEAKVVMVGAQQLLSEELKGQLTGD